jgi:hypothetical protein
MLCIDRKKNSRPNEEKNNLFAAIAPGLNQMAEYCNNEK